MKNLLIVILLFGTMPIYAWEDYTKREIVKVDGSVKVLRSRALSWIADRYVSFRDVVQLDDVDSGKIIAKGITRVRFCLMTLSVRHTIIIEIKENRVRFTVKDPAIVFSSDQREPVLGEEKKIHDTLQGILDDFRTYIKDGSDW